VFIPFVCLLSLKSLCQYVADKILSINERRTFNDPKSLSDDDRAAQDTEIFQRARLVNSAYFVQIILGGKLPRSWRSRTNRLIHIIDYVGTILGLARDGRDWRLDPLMVMLYSYCRIRSTYVDYRKCVNLTTSLLLEGKAMSFLWSST
jgi:hypothetical protein